MQLVKKNTFQKFISLYYDSRNYAGVLCNNVVINYLLIIWLLFSRPPSE